MAKYLKNIQSFEDLKSKYHDLLKKNHPDNGGETEIMQEINIEFDALFKIWKDRREKETGEKVEETAAQTRKHFYTANGWAGSNYSSSLTLKEIAKIVRAYVKEKYPTCKFSIRTSYASMCQELHAEIKEFPGHMFMTAEDLRSAGLWTRKKYTDYYGEEREFRQLKPEIHKLLQRLYANNLFVNESWTDEDLIQAYGEAVERSKFYAIQTELFKAVIEDVESFIKSYNYEDCDGMTDYFDVNFYFFGVKYEDCKEVSKPARVTDKQDKHPATTDTTTETTTEATTAAGYTITPDTDTRDNSPIWVVKLSERVSREEFATIRDEMKTAGGYYSRFKGGFIFKEDPTEKLNAGADQATESPAEATEESPTEAPTATETATAEEIPAEAEKTATEGEEATTEQEEATTAGEDPATEAPTDFVTAMHTEKEIKGNYYIIDLAPLPKFGIYRILIHDQDGKTITEQTTSDPAEARRIYWNYCELWTPATAPETAPTEGESPTGEDTTTATDEAPQEAAEQAEEAPKAEDVTEATETATEAPKQPEDEPKAADPNEPTTAAEKPDTEPQEEPQRGDNPPYGYTGETCSQFDERELDLLFKGAQIVSGEGYHKKAYFTTPYNSAVRLVYSIFTDEDGQPKPNDTAHFCGFITAGMYITDTTAAAQKMAEDVNKELLRMIPDEETAEAHAGQLESWTAASIQRLKEYDYGTDAERLYIKGDDLTLTLYGAWKEIQLTKIISYITDPAETVRAYAERVAQARKIAILEQYIRYNRTAEALQKIQSDPGHRAHLLKRIAQATAGDSAKTYRVTLTSGAEIKASADGVRGIIHNGYMSAWYVESRDRDKLRKDERGRAQDIQAAEIKAIRHGGRVVWAA